MRKVMVIILIAAFLLMGGCWDVEVIDELAIVFGLGIDQDESDPEKIMVTINNPAFNTEAEEQVVRTTVSAYSVSQALLNAQLQRNKSLVLGKLSVIVFSEEAAENGAMHKVLIQLDQIREIDPSALICIVRDDSAQHALNVVPPVQPRAAVYLTELLDRNFNEGRAPRVFLFRYWFDYSTRGITPVIPVIELTGGKEEEEGFILAGLAAIDEQGRMAGQLTDTEIIIYIMLRDEIFRGRFYSHINFAEQKQRLVQGKIKKVDRKVITRIVNDKPVIDIKIMVEADLLDVDLVLESQLEEEVFRGLERALARDFQGNMMRLLRKTQEWETDIVGLGQFVRVHNHKWFRERNWAEEYKNSDINIEVEFRIIRIGTLLNPRY